jgi:hypothetical protein
VTIFLDPQGFGRKALEKKWRVFPCQQGDQIGPIFAFWATTYFGSFFENYSRSPYYWATFCHGKSSVLIKKTGWATSWATFSQTHLVTLLVKKESEKDPEKFELIKNSLQTLFGQSRGPPTG